MTHCPLYNGTNLNFTGTENPYGLIQKGGKKRTRKMKSRRKCGKRYKCKSRKTRKYRR
jgi:hypothetical protein